MSVSLSEIFNYTLIAYMVGIATGIYLHLIFGEIRKSRKLFGEIRKSRK